MFDLYYWSIGHLYSSHGCRIGLCFFCSRYHDFIHYSHYTSGHRQDWQRPHNKSLNTFVFKLKEFLCHIKKVNEQQTNNKNNQFLALCPRGKTQAEENPTQVWLVNRLPPGAGEAPHEPVCYLHLSLTQSLTRLDPLTQYLIPNYIAQSCCCTVNDKVFGGGYLQDEQWPPPGSHSHSDLHPPHQYHTDLQYCPTWPNVCKPTMCGVCRNSVRPVAQYSI